MSENQRGSELQIQVNKNVSQGYPFVSEDIVTIVSIFLQRTVFEFLSKEVLRYLSFGFSELGQDKHLPISCQDVS